MKLINKYYEINCMVIFVNLGLNLYRNQHIEPCTKNK